MHSIVLLRISLQPIQLRTEHQSSNDLASNVQRRAGFRQALEGTARRASYHC